MVSSITTRDAACGDLVLRIRGTIRHGQLLRLHADKCTIGSGPRCTLRLRARGIRPLHCLIVRGACNAVVRRWHPDTRLNGQAFTESLLQSGDRLSVGPVEFEVVQIGHLSEAAPAPSVPDAALDDGATMRGRGEQEWLQRQMELQRQRDALDQLVDSLSQQESSLAERVTQLEAREADLNARRQTFEQQCARHQAESAASQTQADSSRESLDARQAELNAQREDLDMRRRELEERQQRWQRECEQRRQSLEDYSTQVDSRQAELQAEQAELEAARQAFEEQQRQWEAEESQREQPPESQSVELPPTELDVPREMASEPVSASPSSPSAGTSSVVEILRRLGKMPTFDEDKGEPKESQHETLNLNANQAADRRGSECQSNRQDEESGEGEEESIDDYMDRLMKRVRKGASEPDRPKDKASTRNAPRGKSAAAEAVPNASPSRLKNHEQAKMSPRAVAPEKPVDLAAMREVANLSAQTALDQHARRLRERTSFLRLIVAIVALIAGCALFWLWRYAAPSLLTFIAAQVSFAISLLWGIQYVAIVLRRPGRRSKIVETFAVDDSPKPGNSSPLAEAELPLPAADLPAADLPAADLPAADLPVAPGDASN
jgi:hypothetical protein